MRFRPHRYQCPKCRWECAFRKKRCCPGCGTLLLIASDNPTDAELTELKSFWMWQRIQEKWGATSTYEFDAHLNLTARIESVTLCKTMGMRAVIRE
jgi:hypothetical protein